MRIDPAPRTRDVAVSQADRALLSSLGYELLEEAENSPYVWCRPPWGRTMVDPVEELAFIQAVGEDHVRALVTMVHARGVNYGWIVSRRWRQEVGDARRAGREPVLLFPDDAQAAANRAALRTPERPE